MQVFVPVSAGTGSCFGLLVGVGAVGSVVLVVLCRIRRCRRGRRIGGGATCLEGGYERLERMGWMIWYDDLFFML